MIPDDLLYTDQHEWIRVEGDVGAVGITDHAQKALGDLTFVDLPKAGKKVLKGQEACALESCKAAASVYAPANGEIVGANDALNQDPALINTDCYGQGWIYKIRLADKADLAGLMTPAQYKAFLGE